LYHNLNNFIVLISSCRCGAIFTGDPSAAGRSGQHDKLTWENMSAYSSTD